MELFKFILLQQLNLNFLLCIFLQNNFGARRLCSFFEQMLVVQKHLFFWQTRAAIQFQSALKDERASEKAFALNCTGGVRRERERGSPPSQKRALTVCVQKKHLRTGRVRMMEPLMEFFISIAFILHKCRTAVNLAPMWFGRCCLRASCRA
jgi:hypothetical protein